MPSTAAYALYRIVKPNKSVSKSKKKSSPKYMNLMSAYRNRSLMWGLFTATISYFATIQFGTQYIGWYLIFIWILLLLTEIDYRMMLLPDILTFPLLLIGFTYAVMVGIWVGVGDSAIGALIGYFLPVLASLLLVWKNKDVFGGGDIKLLSAIGAWLGVEKLLYVIIISSVLFLIYALLKKKRAIAFGPAISLAAIIVAFWFF